MQKIAKYQGVLKMALIFGLVMPIMASAAINDILNDVIETLNIIVIILFILITIFFIWGVIQYIMAGGDEEKIKTGKQHMLWGLIGLAVVAAAWGIANLLVEYLGVEGGDLPDPPLFTQ